MNSIFWREMTKDIDRLQKENAALKKLIEMQHNEIAKLKGTEE